MSEPNEEGVAGLSCFGGVAAPPELRADLAALDALPEAARAHFWEALGPSLLDPVPPELERRLDVFCAEHGAEPSALGRALRAARSLVRGAARFGVPGRALVQDLETLGASEAVVRVLAGGFERAVTGLRREAAKRAIATHGTLLTGVDWRTDRIVDAREARGLNVDVAVITLRYREGGEERSLTLTALPDMLDELRRIGVVD